MTVKSNTVFTCVYNVHFFPAEKAPKIEMRIIHGILCFKLASLISMLTNTRNVSIHKYTSNEIRGVTRLKQLN